MNVKIRSTEGVKIVEVSYDLMAAKLAALKVDLYLTPDEASELASALYEVAGKCRDGEGHELDVEIV